MNLWNFGKRVFAAYLYRSPAFSRYVDGLVTRELIIPVYDHNPTPERFRAIVRWLRSRGFEFVTSHQVDGFLSGKYKPSKSMVWYSLDDGWSGNLSLLKIVEQDDIPLTIFLSTQPLETGYFPDSQESPFKFSSGDPHSVSRSHSATISNVAQMVHKGLAPDYESASREALTVEQVRALANHPLITIGAHTHRHVALTDCTTGQIDKEIMLNIEYIERYTGSRPKFFAYPYGQFNKDVESHLKMFDFRLIATILNGMITPATNRYSLPRNAVPAGSDKETFCRILNYWLPVRKLLHAPFLKAGKRGDVDGIHGI